MTREMNPQEILIAQAQPPANQTIFTTQTPSVPNDTDGVPYELGLKFQSTRAGQITAIRYWKAVSETGSHVGRIWSSTGTILASINFTSETASGWQQQALTTPLNIQANTTYVVTVNTNGFFAVTYNGALTNSVVNGDLRTVADNNNGVYGNPGTLPTNSYQNANYFRDIVFVASNTTPPRSNAITLENQKPGTTNWRITNQASNEIAGYAVATSVNKGGSLGIKVSLAQPGQYTIDVYRLGYYAGSGGRLVLSSGSRNGITQPACKFTRATRLLECSNWSTSYTLAVGSDWTSGLYIAKLTDSRTGKQSYVWFVVRDDSRTSDILFQSSFNNHLAYSNYGPVGSRYSLYPFNSTNLQRAVKVSYDRPFSQTTTETGEFNNLLRWEYNMVRWLESQGYDLSYVTNVDVHSNSQLLLKYKVFLSVGHDEYWSKEQRDHVERARDAGVNLAFFCANSAYWRVRFENSTITGQANRVMVCYKQAATASEPTDKFRSQLNNRPESALLGVMYVADEDVVYGGFDFVVKNSSDPYYANTGLKDNDTLGRLVGFEWDRINANASPNGLVILGESQFPGARQDIDNTDIEGFPSGTDPRVSHAVRYTAPSGAKVFSTGSIQWMWGLDSDGVDGPREDNRAKQIAVNVFASMGARPLTPSANIIVP
ncbi:DUF4082 domain-containing protein [Iningainema tapete]|uniref:DUF4082 domain-containing protein n=1 Tax=Iningainema tapete BLCC-T55 TaxID=2748662 RepID=A0A8J6XFK0_9CYAN|nr:DUF4082 domain-containing protein [Iningainema tapete]MBD2772090.1 DUF4082 domain-containing protein [Iningainema tapete BLCC-T55]